MVLLKRPPPKGRRLLILATSSVYSMVTDTQMAEVFDSTIRVPPISNLRSLEAVVKEMELFKTPEERQRAMAMLEQSGFGGPDRLNIGVKKLLSIVEMARQETEDRAERLVTELQNLHF